MSTEFRPLKKGDLVVCYNYDVNDNLPTWSLQSRGFILGEIARGSRHGWSYCSVFVLIQSKNYYQTSYPVKIGAGYLRKADLHKIKK